MKHIRGGASYKSSVISDLHHDLSWVLKRKLNILSIRGNLV
jgi:hypothetical protein